jgi:hypothetical protein
MTRTDCATVIWLGAVLTVTSLSNANCGAAGSRAPAPRLESATSLEVECERGLLYLDSLIETRTRSVGFSRAVLAEASELRRSARELFLTGDLELALEMIDEAVVLLKD